MRASCSNDGNQLIKAIGRGYCRPVVSMRRPPARRSASGDTRGEPGQRRGQVTSQQQRQETVCLPHQDQEAQGDRAGCSQLHHGYLQLQYTQSLEQQIALLELENAFLKSQEAGGGGLVPRPVNLPSKGVDDHEVTDPHRNSQAPPPARPSLPHHRENRDDSFVRRRESAMTPIAERVTREEERGERVVLREEERRERVTREQERGERVMREQGRGERVTREEENEEGPRAFPVHFPPSSNHLSRIHIERTTDSELLHRLEEYSNKLLDLERKLKEKMREARGKEESLQSLRNRMREMESSLNSRADADAQHKRALMEEILELQRRLDELTPTLAQKESLIAKTEGEKDAAFSRLRATQAELGSLQIRLKEKARGDLEVEEREEEHRREKEKLSHSLQLKDNDISRLKGREAQLSEEVVGLRSKAREVEMQNEEKKIIIDKMREEKAILSSEISRLAAEVSRLTMRAESAERELESAQADRAAAHTLAQVSESERLLRMDLRQTASALETEREKLKLAEKNMEEAEKRDKEWRLSRGRLEKELGALHALSASLSAENTTLREEKIHFENNLAALRQKVQEKERAMHEAEDQSRETERRLLDSLAKCEEEANAQRLKSIELEELGQKLRDLSESVQHRSSRSSTLRSVTTSRVVDEAVRGRAEKGPSMPPPSRVVDEAVRGRAEPKGPSMPPPCGGGPLRASHASPPESPNIDEVIQMTRSALGQLKQN